MMLLTFMSLVALVNYIYIHVNLFLIEFLLFSVNSIDYSFTFIIDQITLTYLYCVSYVTSMVLIFSAYYMKGTENYRRFLYLLLLFVLSMVLLVSSGNFVTTMVGWDGLGVTSFCLVIFYESSNSMSSGVLTILTNRLGDSFFLCSLFYFMMSGQFGGVSSVESKTLAALLLIGSATKSAQLPFCSWLPAAMAAPTPVSSLVHSSTLVTAGVWVMMRYDYIINEFDLYVKVTSMVTMMLAGLMAVVETDMKKLVAMSTLSQLGMMIFCFSLSLKMLGIFHMTLHSFFKSMMFLSTGSIMASSKGSQDSRFNPTTLNLKSSLTSSIVSSMCLSGFPFVLGFYTKDTILSYSTLSVNILFWLMFLFACSVTVLYSLRFTKILINHKMSSLSIMSLNNSKIIGVPLTMLFIYTTTMGPVSLGTFMNESFFFKFTDISSGVSIIILSLLLFNMLKTKKKSTFLIGGMIFMNWVSNNGISQVSDLTNIQYMEQSWFETMSSIQLVSNWLKSKVKSYSSNHITSILAISVSITMLVT